ncbi:MAG TPA: serine hydrolase [Bacillota bacterium]|nr:serine hydrolase [Bacillota bacterium]
MKHQLTRRLLQLFAVFLIITAIIIQPFSAQAAEAFDLEAESAILVDAETGKVLYAKNADMALPPASMTKMMTEYLVWEAIESGDIDWDTTTQISDYAYEISADETFSGIGLTQSKDYTVKELYEAMAVFSDNATTIALAELIAGSEGEFVKMMNDKAEEMGLPDYKFVNASGLDNESLGDNYPEGTDPDASNMLSARSAALLAYNLVNDFPDALDVSSQTEVEFEDYTIENLNWMLPHDSVNFKQFYYEGMDGLKTGYTDSAGYCFTGTAEQNGKRLISVVMKTESESERFEETAKLMDYGFNNFETVELFPKGHQTDDKKTLPVAKGKEDEVAIETDEAISVPIKKGNEDKYTLEYTFDEDVLNEDGELTAPIEKGDKVGTAKLVFDGEDYGYISEDMFDHTVDIVAADTVEKNNWFMLTLGAIGDFFSNMFSWIGDTVKGWF